MLLSKSETLPHPPKKPRLLWANVYCLMDTSSGASMAVREMLLQLVKNGYEVAVLGATIFDNPKGVTRLQKKWDAIKSHKGKLLSLDDGPLQHKLVVTADTDRNAMTAKEESTWFMQYGALLSSFKPDLVFYYGGNPLDMMIASEAKFHGIATAAYLANGNYTSLRWCRDVDLIITDSHATAQMYEEKLGIKPIPVGAFIDPRLVVGSRHSRKRVLFINPAPEKGVGVVVRLAMMLEKRRPDIVFEVVESRGSWQEMLEAFSKGMGTPRSRLDNVVVTPNTSDMRPVFERARLLLAPSLWWESSGRVLAEAMLNGIPALITDRGGMPEVIQDGGIKIKFPPKCHEKPYTNVPTEQALEGVVIQIIRLYDDQAFYDNYVSKAKKVGLEHHGLERNTQRLIDAINPWMQRTCVAAKAVVAPVMALKSQAFVNASSEDELAVKTPLVLVCGPWSGGTSATAGVLAALGLNAPGPYVGIHDPRTPNTYEMKAFQLLLQSLVSELSLERLVTSSEMVRALTHFRDVTLPAELKKQGMDVQKPVMLKHALASFILPEICQVFDVQLVVVTRPIADIESTRVRRSWPAQYGSFGASQIYGHVFSYVVNAGLPYRIVRYPELLARPQGEVDELADFIAVAVSAEQKRNAVTFVTNRAKA